ncbi:hypothetical protein MNR02_14620 [Shinella sp. H4-D48]|uniref:phosphorylase family protein n=1 Tax=Shinella sp. H4-D48 TaxID=2925841 RepID=UPI001F5354E5|nr:hypothetical protein [Shinella sp. H4-D48]UNK37682.1 hypothetical protein MNR02_14620 [Shinella sp. H4-D48]
MISLHVLIVEDVKSKYDIVRRGLLKKFKAESIKDVKITRAESYTDAILKCNSSYFDVIILDLKIPFVDKGMPEFSASVQFLKFIEGSRYKPFKTVGLSSFSKDDYDAEAISKLRLEVWKYDPLDFSWLDQILLTFKTVSAGKDSLLHFQQNNYELDVLIVTARYANEYVPVMKEIQWISSPEVDVRLGENLKNQFGQIRLKKGTTVSVGIVCIQTMGLSVSAAVAGFLISLLRPRYLFMLGMCCGLKDDRCPSKLLIGDVLVATETACWDEGKYSEEVKRSDPFYVKARPRVPSDNLRKSLSGFLETNEENLQTALAEVCGRFKLSEIEKSCGEEITKAPNVHAGLMLSGSSVVDSVSQVALVRERFSSAIGLEMEAHAIYSAVDSTVGIAPNALVIKGVADHGQGKKNKAAQPWAAALSYAVALEVLRAQTW